MSTVRFYLVRHAKAEPGDPKGDAARRLTPEGRERFAAHAVATAPRLALSRIVTSPLHRARETGDLLAAATRAPVEAEEALAPGASSGRALLELGKRLGAGVALVGHNPELAEAVSLAAERDVDLKTGAIAAVDAVEGLFRLAWIEAP
ncbi:MAG TPA: histidine phosphatase family protein [Anaeromyxobacter sp.]